jgi:hypothetical protein
VVQGTAGQVIVSGWGSKIAMLVLRGGLKLALAQVALGDIGDEREFVFDDPSDVNPTTTDPGS